MTIDILTIFPEMFESVLNTSIWAAPGSRA